MQTNEQNPRGTIKSMLDAANLVAKGSESLMAMIQYLNLQLYLLGAARMRQNDARPYRRLHHARQLRQIECGAERRRRRQKGGGRRKKRFKNVRQKDVSAFGRVSPLQ